MRSRGSPELARDRTVEPDFDLAMETAPRMAVAEGLSDAFRSPETPPFSKTLAHLFGHSAPPQRTAVLNSLMATLGPDAVARQLKKAAIPGADRIAVGRWIEPDLAEDVSPDAVEELAAAAEQRDSRIVDRLAEYYAVQPALIKTLGEPAISVVLAHLRREANEP